MRDVVRDFGNMDARLHGGNVLHPTGDDVDAAHVLGVVLLVVLLQQPVDRGDHADDLFFRDLHAPTDRVAVGIIVGGCEIGEVFPAKQQAGVLRPAYTLPTGETYEVIAHPGVIP